VRPFLALVSYLTSEPAGPTTSRGPDISLKAETNTSELRVVICDDHPAFAEGLARLLSEETSDFQVVATARSAEELEEMVDSVLPDVVLIDIRMPKVDGIEATRRIRQKSPTTTILILTVSDEKADLFQALKAGAMGYITKDRDVSQIVDAMRSVARGNLVIPSYLAELFLNDLRERGPESLSETETEILRAIAKGETNREIAQRLFLSERTVCRRIEDIYSKLHFADRLQAAIWAVQRGLGETDEQGLERRTKPPGHHGEGR
jgi:DNA-binding NarL/FixJ family response regulator